MAALPKSGSRVSIRISPIFKRPKIRGSRLRMNARSFAFVVRLILTCALILAGSFCGIDAQESGPGFAAIRASLVKVWAFDALGKPIAAGTGFVVESGQDQSHIITAAHVVSGAASLRIDVSRDVHDVPAKVVDVLSGNDIALLQVQRGGLAPAKFASRVVEVGDTFATAGFYRSDDIQLPRLLYPSTVSIILEQGRVVAFDNVDYQEGLSGAPVFDPLTGSVVAVVSTRRTTGSGGFALSGLRIYGYLRNDLSLNVASDRAAGPTVPTILSGAAAAGGTTSASAAVKPARPGSNGAAIEEKCGPGVIADLDSSITATGADFAANDYMEALKEARHAVVVAKACTDKLYVNCQNGCDPVSGIPPDRLYILVFAQELSAQQYLRVATARMTKDVTSSEEYKNAVRNEMDSATALCASPNISLNEEPYVSVRTIIKTTLGYAKEAYRSRFFRGVFDVPEIQSCAKKMGFNL